MVDFIAVLVMSPGPVAIQVGQQMIPGVLELITVQSQPYQPHPEGKQLVVAVGLAHDSAALADGLRGDGEAQIDVGFCATGVEGRIKAAPFNGAAIKDRMLLSRHH